MIQYHSGTILGHIMALKGLGSSFEIYFTSIYNRYSLRTVSTFSRCDRETVCIKVIIR